eukprot:CAMPEP_0117081242 /NCGR_PEP_ID=MMETSP0472-20121206/57272_1 /TAXON_ID=693140 ORGANISM="Tiarina fusus, Strain LIS" /NCGR_SAMPLE_ID=MMETSP0472 /ASSEMBLY_ACC=CAM_ASM_000603 /LENGTH=372 /DNA_ID=CAMNT_0004809115 /DNA_START=172 /DNA_END=1285 /DNA_ORIENTATION=+
MAENRTSEFMALAKSLPGSKTGPSTLSTASGRYGSAPNSTNSQKSNANNYAQLKDFHATAGGISRDIAAASAMLGDLTRLVRQKSLFQDDTQKINDLVVRIKGSIENLNGRLDDAGRVIAQQKNRKSQAGQEASNVVGQLKEEFGEAAAGFKKVLQQRTDVLKETTDRKMQIYGAKEETSALSLENKPPVYGDSMGGAGFPTLDLTSGMTAGESTSSGSQLPRPHGATSYEGMRLRKQSSDPIPTYSGSQSSYYGRQDSSPLTPWDLQKMEAESGQSQMMQLIPDQDYLQERANAELGTIFNKLAVMVNEHKDMVQRVEDNVDDANTSINLSLSTLTDTLTNLQTNRALFFKIFSIFVVFIIAFIIFIAVDG